MKNQLVLFIILVCASGCSVFRPGTTSDGQGASTYQTGSSGRMTSSRSKFINTISTDENTAAGEKSSGVEMNGSSRERYPVTGSSYKKSAGTEKNEKFNELQFKYAILTNTPIELLTNQKLLDFMDEWYGVPYHYGGHDKSGIDCSAFASLLIS
ncbi:MAG TPA: hypothetical protein VGM24_12585, partial [Puia sp.]